MKSSKSTGKLLMLSNIWIYLIDSRWNLLLKIEFFVASENVWIFTVVGFQSKSSHNSLAPLNVLENSSRIMPW